MLLSQVRSRYKVSYDWELLGLDMCYRECIYFWVDHIRLYSGVNSENRTSRLDSQDRISFSEVDIITPAQKLMASQLSCEIVAGKSLLVTGW